VLDPDIGLMPRPVVAAVALLEYASGHIHLLPGIVQPPQAAERPYGS